LRSTTNPKIFNVESFSRAIACCWYLTSNQNVLIYTTHTEKAIARLNFVVLRSKTTEKQQQVKNFAEVRNFAWHWHLQVANSVATAVFISLDLTFSVLSGVLFFLLKLWGFLTLVKFLKCMLYYCIFHSRIQ